MKKLTLNEIHVRTLEIMDFIHNFCEQNNIKYVLGYGTLLGAIRHKGFIPWDDDFDIQMPRSDFNKFCELFQKEKCGYFKLVCRANDKGYTNGIPRVFDNRFIYESVGEKKTGVVISNMGIFIDIYPFDNFGNDKACAHRLTKMIKRINFLYTIYVNKYSVGNVARKIIRSVVHYILRAIYGTHYNEKVDEKIYKIIKKHTDVSDKFVGQATWEVGENQFDKSWFSDRLLAPYEDRMYWIPKDYDNILRKSYGDYMILPPESQRRSYHGYNIYLKKQIKEICK